MQYYDIQKKWRKVQSAIDHNPHINNVLVRDSNKFTFGRIRDVNNTKHATCHWLVKIAASASFIVSPAGISL